MFFECLDINTDPHFPSLQTRIHSCIDQLRQHMIHYSVKDGVRTAVILDPGLQDKITSLLVVMNQQRSQSYVLRIYSRWFLKPTKIGFMS